MKRSVKTGPGTLASRILMFATPLCFLGIILLFGLRSADLILWAIHIKEDREEAMLFLAGALALMVLAALLTIVMWKNIQLARKQK